MYDISILVVALKELSIRGDFRTIVEHLIMLLEKTEFIKNSMNTGWLDELIAKKEKAEKPNTMLSLICGALCVAEGIISSNFETFKASLERGQTQPATILKNSVKVDLLYEGMKYCVRATKTGKFIYTFYLLERYLYFHMISNFLTNVESLIQSRSLFRIRHLGQRFNSSQASIEFFDF